METKLHSSSPFGQNSNQKRSLKSDLVALSRYQSEPSYESVSSSSSSSRQIRSSKPKLLVPQLRVTPNPLQHSRSESVLPSPSKQKSNPDLGSLTEEALTTPTSSESSSKKSKKRNSVKLSTKGPGSAIIHPRHHHHHHHHHVRSSKSASEDNVNSTASGLEDITRTYSPMEETSPSRKSKTECKNSATTKPKKAEKTHRHHKKSEKAARGSGNAASESKQSPSPPSTPAFVSSQSIKIDDVYLQDQEEDDAQLRKPIRRVKFSRRNLQRASKTPVEQPSPSEDKEKDNPHTYDLSASLLSSMVSSIKLQRSSSFGTDCFDLICAPLPLRKIVLILHNSFNQGNNDSLLDEELTVFFYSYSLYISTASLLQYFLFDYIPGIQRTYGERTAPLRATLSAFVQRFLSVWAGVDPRLRTHAKEIIAFISTNKDGLSLNALHGQFLHLEEADQPGLSSPTSSVPSLNALEERTRLHQEFFEATPLEAATHLQMAHLDVYRKVWPWDLLASSTGVATIDINRLIAAVPDHFNKTVAWIQTSCLKPDSARARAQKITHWIAIAEAAWQAHYLPVLLLIMTALNHPVVTRTKQTWELVPQASVLVFESLIPLALFQNNYQAIRKQALMYQTPLPLAILSKDLTILLEILRSPSKSMHMNTVPYHDIRKIASIIYRGFLPSVSLHLEPTLVSNNAQDEMRSFLMDPLPRLLIDRLFQLSYSHEPPPKEFDKEVVVTNPLLRVKSPERHS